MEIDIPIVAFPPFQLRSSMIDKDPVIWSHLLEVYIELFQKLIILTDKRDAQLSTRSKQQLTAFLKGYLYESSEEATKVFSLGAINPDIVESQRILKLVVFQFIKTFHLVNLQLTGSSVWDFCKVYVKLAVQNMSTNQSLININVVRKLVEGRNVQDHVIKLVAEKKFNRADLETLYALLGQRIQPKGSKNANNRYFGRVSKEHQQSSNFAVKFVNSYWINEIERLFNNGESIHSEQCFQLMLVSIVSLDSSKTIDLIRKELNVKSMNQLLKDHPLLAKIILSKRYQDINPDITGKLEYLQKHKTKTNTKTKTFDLVKIKEVLDFFPQLNEAQVKTLLVDNKGEVSSIVNKLLESPDDIGSVKEYIEKPSNVVDYKLKGKNVEVQFGKKQKSREDLDRTTKEELKKKSLVRALNMMYESDEDEPDDTYIDSELTEGPAIKRSSKKGPAKENALDMKLFLIYKSDPDLFATRNRHTNYRGQLKKEFGWVDEQIEGWARMLERNPHKYRLLEQQQIESGGSLNDKKLKPRTKYRKGEGDGDGDGDGDEDEDYESTRRVFKPHNQHQHPPPGPPDTRKQQRDKSKNKASRGNHNRKNGHDKKMSKLA
ncbi:hypothetical protein FOA43_001844 [Brettanomyces nanus]|uniref:CUE domain-containing protein n=1 Tax=Eeniella nana TaxID=13502 RepID=A0A875S5P4_EENNA|nr:uncharacterized protein FOA43_001844 [Brettanomyces nanus]QPG74514.1 hypothetical protein FOA43_001844 [Brettanomyces nanus]